MAGFAQRGPAHAFVPSKVPWYEIADKLPQKPGLWARIDQVGLKCVRQRLKGDCLPFRKAVSRAGLLKLLFYYEFLY
jgi:hypothetical protein